MRSMTRRVKSPGGAIINPVRVAIFDGDRRQANLNP